MFDRIRATRRTLLAALSGMPAASSAFASSAKEAQSGVPSSQHGAGAIVRDVQEKLRDTISVKDFGAKGDGAVDDTGAIRAALAHAGGFSVRDEPFEGYGYVLKGGATVYLPAGTYRTSDTLEVPQNVSLVGAGKHSSVIWSTSERHVLRNVAKSTVRGSYDRSGIALRDFGIIGDRTKPQQVGLGLLRMQAGLVENLHISKCGSHGLDLLQVGCSIFINIQSVRNVGHGLSIGRGKDNWDLPDNDWPSNANIFHFFHGLQNDGAGLQFRQGSNGNLFFDPVCEYNFLAAGDNAGCNVLSASDSYAPNILYGLWTEGPVECHVRVDHRDSSIAIELVDWRHFGDGAFGKVDRALIVHKGTARLRQPVSPAVPYRTIAGSRAPFRLADLATALLSLTDACGAEVLDLETVEGPGGRHTGLENNLRISGFDTAYGPVKHYMADGGVTADEWYTDTLESNPYLRIEPFHKALAFGDGRGAPDVMLKRVGPRTLGLDKERGAQFFDHGSAWNGNHVLMGMHHLWVDAAGNLRIKNGAPTSDSDGAVVGTRA